MNSASGEVSYDLTPQEVIDAFNAVYPGSKGDYESLKNEFEEFNEQGCPLNNSDGSNNNTSENISNNFSTMAVEDSPESDASVPSSGGGSFGLWEIMALLTFGLREISRARRRRF